jgi:hypothetical protein
MLLLLFGDWQHDKIKLICKIINDSDTAIAASKGEIKRKN